MQRAITTVSLGLVILLLALALNGCASQASYPTKPVTLVVPQPAGGAMDLTARTTAELLKGQLSQSIVVVNREGGSTTIGTAEVAQAKPDGYTIGLLSVAGISLQPHRAALPYKGPEDFTPVINLVNQPFVLAVNADSPYKTIQDLLAFAKANPGKVRIGNSGVGTMPHLRAEQLRIASGIDFISVPHAGDAEGLPALLGGHIDAYAAHPSALIPQVKAGKLRPLAVYEAQHISAWPDIPTFKELGYDITGGVYYLIAAPKGTPNEIVKTLHDAFKKMMDGADFAKFAQDNKMDIDYLNGADLAKRLQSDYETNGKVAELVGWKQR